MEPTTLYLLYQFKNGPERAKEFPFDSVVECEQHVSGQLPKEVKVVRYSCDAYRVGLKPPEWYTAHNDQKLIHGVPVDPNLFR